jgi:hypothetical protein
MMTVELTKTQASLYEQALHSSGLDPQDHTDAGGNAVVRNRSFSRVRSALWEYQMKTMQAPPGAVPDGIEAEAAGDVDIPDVLDGIERELRRAHFSPPTTDPR